MSNELHGDAEVHYDAAHIAFLEEMWGDGYLSPGGPNEVQRVLDGIDLVGKRVLDIGCGSGGITVSLVREYGAGSVVGIDVEEPVVVAASERVDASGVAEQIDIVLVEPGPVPFEAGEFDIVFSKDSIVHIADKVALSADIFRVLKPGGWFVASDWLIGHDGEPSAEMKRYLELEDLGFGMASPETYAAALVEAGFGEVELRNRNEWYAGQARLERERLAGPDRERFDATLGTDEVNAQIATWDAMQVVLDSGEHCPHHVRGRKPLAS